MLQMLLLIFSTGFYFIYILVFFRHILVTGLQYLPSDMSYRSLYAKEVTKAGSTNVLSPSKTTKQQKLAKQKSSRITQTECHSLQSTICFLH